MSNQPPLNPDALAQLIMWKELPFGGNPDNYIRLDANAAHKVIELLKSHLAVAQPVVNSVEELDQLPEGSVFIDDDGSVCQIEIDGESHFNGDPYRRFSMVGDFKGYELDEVTFPARVLYRPKVKP